MENTTYIAISRQMGLRRSMEVVANNIANANTPAFKAERLVFQEYMAEPARNEELAFVQDIGTARDLSPGPLTKTDNDLDVALAEPNSYFVVDTPLGERFTRHGRFQLDANGQIVTSQGYPVLGQAGPISIPINNDDAGPIAIASDGSVSKGQGLIDQLRVVSFDDEQKLRKAANGLFIPAEGQQPQAIATPSVTQGMVEDSNVQPILELTRMMEVNRNYESVTRFVQREDDRIKDMIDRLSKTTSS